MSRARGRDASDRLKFLAGPAEIRQAVGELSRRASRMDLAVAFVGRDWRDAIADFRGPLRMLCWLTSTNTDPRAVRQMMRRPRIEVRQRDSMHAKVYLAQGVGAVVGSANLSRRALAEVDESGQDEAAVFLSDARSVHAIDAWFRRLWQSDGSRGITEPDLRRALKAFKKARARMARGGERRRRHGGPGRGVDDLPAPRRSTLVRLADRVRDVNLSRELPIHRLLASMPVARLGRAELERIVDEFEEWMGRRFLFERAFLRRPLSRVRVALALLFDEALDVEERLSRVIAARALAPLKVSTLSILLYWRSPGRYPPFNRRTKRFLRDFRFLEAGASNASPAAYGRWLAQAEKYSQELALPTPGHVDRVVWEYTQSMRL